MSIITLTTDWQNRDYYSGMMQGRLLSLMPNATVIGINQQIEPFHIVQASFVLRQAIREYPDDTIHLFMVNQGHRPGIWPAVARYKNQYIIGWDDGNMALIMESGPEYYLRLDAEALTIMDRMTGLEERYRHIEASFPEISLFTRIALYLSMGLALEQAGPHTTDFGRYNSWLPVIQKNQIDGQVVYIDSYQNAITNIPRSEFSRIGTNRTFEITIKSNRYKVFGINSTYLESEPGELLAIFNSAGLLEIAVAQGNAAELLGFEPGTNIKIKFDEE